MFQRQGRRRRSPQTCHHRGLPMFQRQGRRRRSPQTCHHQGLRSRRLTCRSRTRRQRPPRNPLRCRARHRRHCPPSNHRLCPPHCRYRHRRHCPRRHHRRCRHCRSSPSVTSKRTPAHSRTPPLNRGRGALIRLLKILALKMGTTHQERGGISCSRSRRIWLSPYHTIKVHSLLNPPCLKMAQDTCRFGTPCTVPTWAR